MRMFYALAVVTMVAGATLPAVAQTAGQTTTNQTSSQTTVQPRQGGWWQSFGRATNADNSGFAQSGAAIANAGGR
jgi:hypothetical protein